MREMDFTIEDVNALTIGQKIEVIESQLPSAYYYTMEHALGMSGNFKSMERLKTRVGSVKEIKETPRFHVAVLEFDE